jgi:hypothetical protein
VTPFERKIVRRGGGGGWHPHRSGGVEPSRRVVILVD